MRLSCPFCNELKPPYHDKVDPKGKGKLPTYFLFFPWKHKLKKKKKKDISNWANPFKEQEDLPDSWSILIERAGLWGAESSLKE